ncbi:MAG: hypothetical protein ACP5UT_05000 [Bryobacteraceae bacterium]
MSSDTLLRLLSHAVMAAILLAALRRATPVADALWTAAVAGVWVALGRLTGDPRLLFPFAMACGGAAVWRYGPKGALAAGAIFLLMRAAAGTPLSILITEALGAALSLAAAGAMHRAGPAAAALAGSLTALAALLL